MSASEESVRVRLQADCVRLGVLGPRNDLRLEASTPSQQATRFIRRSAHHGSQGIQARHRVPGCHRPDVRQVITRVAGTTPLEGRRAERTLHRPGRHWLRPARLLRQPDRDAEPRRAGQGRTAVHEHAHDRALLADALVHPDGTQPPLERDVVHHRRLDRISRRQRLHSVRERVPLGHPPRERLQHLLPREVAPGPERADERGGTLQPLAARSRLRALLRLPRWRHASVLPRAGVRQPHRRAGEDS